MNVTSLAAGVIKIEREDGTFLGIATGINTRTFSITKLAEKRSATGWYIHENIVEEWPIHGFMESDGIMYMFGPYIEGILLSRVLEDPREDKLSYLSRIANAYSVLNERGLSLAPLYSRGILFSTSGGILLFPPALMKVIKDHEPLADRIRHYELFNHPDFKGEDAVSCSLGALSYYLFTGEYPYLSGDEEVLHTMMRERDVVPPLFRKPEIRPAVSDFIVSALQKSPSGLPSLMDWKQTIESWARDGVTREVSQEEREQLLSRAEEINRKHEAVFSRKSFLRKKGSTILAVLIVLVVVGWIGGSILSNVLAPRVIKGFSPEMVVRTFYTSVNELNHTTMEDCVSGDAGKPLINEVMNIYVLSRMRYSYEGRSGLVDASEWVESGRPEVPEGQSVYGVADFQILEGRVREETAEFLVRYEKWQPVVPPDDLEREYTGPRYEGLRITEQISMILDDESWLISNIQLIEENPIPYQD